MKFFPQFSALNCKEGYLQTTGHIPDQGTTSDQRNSFKKCGESCDANSECISYEYGPKESCHLNKKVQQDLKKSKPCVLCIKQISMYNLSH